MEVKAQLKHLRMSPTKVRLVADVVRGSQISRARAQLHFMKKLAAVPMSKVLESAVANATHNFNLEENNLFIKSLTVDEGTTLKRWMPKAHGRATKIRKRGCHINLILGEVKDSGVVAARNEKVEAPMKLGTKPAEVGQAKVKSKDIDAIHEDETEKGDKLTNPSAHTGRSGHSKIEGSSKRGFVGKMFNRKAG